MLRPCGKGLPRAPLCSPRPLPRASCRSLVAPRYRERPAECRAARSLCPNVPLPAVMLAGCPRSASRLAARRARHAARE